MLEVNIMASKRTTKKVVKKVAKAAKKDPKIIIILLVIALVIVSAGVALYFFVIKPMNDRPKESDLTLKLKGSSKQYVSIGGTYVEAGAIATFKGEDVSNEIVTSYFNKDNECVTAITTDVEASFTAKYDINHENFSKSLTRQIIVSDVSEMSINFLELGNKYTGDCTYIKAGDTDILIDAGSRNGSAATISAFVDQYCTDGKLEYVIATHAHQDHIAGFVGTNAAPGIFAKYEVETIIDFALHNTTSKVYTDYIAARDAEIALGAKHYTALDCVKETNGAHKIYELSAGITMEILYQKFYETNTSDENDYSVCTLFTQGDNHYLFTGDLEKDGEASLVASNTLPEVELFKGGHHGSYTANTDTLLSVIKPETVCICCCAGSDEYTSNPDNMFPAQDAINRIGKYTDKVYVTTVVSDVEPGYQSMNGNILFYCESGSGYTVTGSNNNTILKETEWFRKNRTWPSV